ncbi:MAG TPA: lysophospholipid acyltransferase family protein [Gammaproteobacteria bacterium]|nr:lysophospholipid acyltransferase family protein [Gammaproteobacteria bacterium]
MRPTATWPAWIRVGYGLYAWIALLVCGLPALVLVSVVPGRSLRRRLTHWLAALFFLAIGSPIRVLGRTRMPNGACVVVANHASYLDGIILTAALPPNFTFVIKREMAHFPFAGFLLRRIGSEFVDRADHNHRKRTTRRLFKAARSGAAHAFFPEGTFTPEPGLRPFKNGAFRLAWQSRLPLVPIVIRGARAKLPAESWLPVPGALEVEICDPIDPNARESAAALTAAARRALLDKLDEPDLDS